MAKIVCITSGLTGILNASFELMDRLKSDGHQIICATPWDVSEKVKRQGFEYEKLPPIDFAPVLVEQKRVRSNWKKLLDRYKNISANRNQLLKQIYPSKYIDFLNRHQPDLVLLDIELHEYIIMTQKEQVPFVLLNQFFSIWRRPKLPYLKSEIIPGQGWKGSDFGIWLTWMQVKFRRWLQFGKQKLKSGFTDRRSLLLALAKQQGFPKKYIGENYWPGPFLYDELPVFNLVSEELEFPHNKRVNSFYVGPMVNNQRKDLAAQTMNNYSFVDVFEYVEANQAKVIYCSISTLKQGDLSFLNKVIDAVRIMKNWTLVISTGKLIKESAFIDLPDNVFTFSFCPQLEILSKADCSINHGGVHTINECINFGVPMLVYSGKKSDQNGNATRVVFHEVGLMGDKDDDGVEEIRKKIDRVLSKEIYKKKIQELKEAYLRDKDSKLLEKTIRSFL